MAWENIWHDFLNLMYTYSDNRSNKECGNDSKQAGYDAAIGVMCQEDNKTLEKVTYKW